MMILMMVAKNGGSGDDDGGPPCHIGQILRSAMQLMVCTWKKNVFGNTIVLLLEISAKIKDTKVAPRLGSHEDKTRSPFSG